MADSGPGPNLSTGAGPARVSERVLGAVEIAALAFLIACGLAAWTMGLVSRAFDYDEGLRAHSAWLSTRGLRPYDDFFECHPPYFALLAPVYRVFPDPYDALRALRWLGTIGNLLFLAGLATLGATIPGGRRWAWLGLAAVACEPAIVDYLLEFRVDGWGYAVATWGIVRFRRSRRGISRDLELGVVAGIATLLFCPKLAFLPPLVVLFDHLGASETAWAKLRAGLAYAAGSGVAAGLFLLYLTWHGIDPRRMTLLLGRFNATVNESTGFHHGLYLSLLANPALKWSFLAGVAGLVVSRLRSRSWPNPHEGALACWLVLQASVVNSPFKQYYAPWYLFGSYFVGCVGQGSADLLASARLIAVPRSPRIGRAVRPALGTLGRLGRARERINRGSPDLLAMARGYLARHPWTGRPSLAAVARAAAFVAAAATIGPESYRVAKERNGGDAASQGDTIRWMNWVTRPGDHVLASLPLHPIERFDTFYLWFNVSTLNGFDAASVLESIPQFREVVTQARAREELEANPPALVCLPSFNGTSYSAAQKAALAEFLRERDYQPVPGKAIVLRPDRMDRADRLGLIKPLDPGR